MDKYILINLNMFAVDNQVLVINGLDADTTEIGTYSIEQLPDVIAELAHETGIYKIKIAGNSKFAELVNYGITTKEMFKYNENKIEIEVI